MSPKRPNGDPVPRDAIDLLDLAAAHLHAAAVLADEGDADLTFGSAFAGQIRLAAATLPVLAPLALPESETAGWIGQDMIGQLRAALYALDQIHPLHGPPDLRVCAWHVHELIRIATTHAETRVDDHVIPQGWRSRNSP